MLLNKQQITEEIKKEKKFLETNKTQWSKNIGNNKSSSKKEVYNTTILPQETRKISNKLPNLILYLKQRKNKQHIDR